MEVRKLKLEEYDSFYNHLLSLNFSDRHSRFSGAISDSSIKMYVSSIEKLKDEVWVIVDSDIIVGAAHIGVMDSIGEIGVSINENYRSMGFGTMLLDHCFERCKQLGLKKAMTVCASKNSSMIKLSRKMKMIIQSNFSEAFAEHVF